MAKHSSLSSSASHIPLMDTERDIQDTNCSLVHIPFYQQVLLNDKASPVYFTMAKSSFMSACIPRTHIFPELISSMVSVMYLGNFFMMNFQGENIVQLFAQLIRQALCYPKLESCVQFFDEYLVACYDNLTGEDFNQLVYFLNPNTQQF